MLKNLLSKMILFPCWPQKLISSLLDKANFNGQFINGSVCKSLKFGLCLIVACFFCFGLVPNMALAREDSSSGTVSIQSDAASGNMAFTRLNRINVTGSAVLHVGAGTTFKMNLLDLF